MIEPERALQLCRKQIECHARRFANAHAPIEDLEQEARIAVVKCAGTYRARRGAQFTTYAEPFIKYAMWKYMNRKSHVIHLPEWQQRAGAARVAIASLDAHPFDVPGEDVLQPVESDLAFEAMIAPMRPLLQRIFRLRYVEELNWDEIGAATGRRVGACQTYHGRALATLRRQAHW